MEALRFLSFPVLERCGIMVNGGGQGVSCEGKIQA